jgi:hypothetical protein
MRRSGAILLIVAVFTLSLVFIYRKYQGASQRAVRTETELARLQMLLNAKNAELEESIQRISQLEKATSEVPRLRGQASATARLKDETAQLTQKLSEQRAMFLALMERTPEEQAEKEEVARHMEQTLSNKIRDFNTLGDKMVALRESLNIPAAMRDLDPKEALKDPALQKYADYFRIQYEIQTTMMVRDILQTRLHADKKEQELLQWLNPVASK